MGRQISFYMSREDEIEFVDFVRETGDVVILSQTSSRANLEEFDYFFELAGREYGEGCHLWNRDLSLTPKIKHFPEQEYFCLDFMQSEVLNPWRSKITKHGLSMGRIHVEDRYLTDDMESLSKSEAFLAWYKDICTWITKHSVRKANGAYVLPGAASMIDESVELTGHSF